jgi:hypothetical protein
VSSAVWSPSSIVTHSPSDQLSGAAISSTPRILTELGEHMGVPDGHWHGPLRADGTEGDPLSSRERLGRRLPASSVMDGSPEAGDGTAHAIPQPPFVVWVMVVFLLIIRNRRTWLPGLSSQT